MTFDQVKEEFLLSATEASEYQSWITELDDARYCRWDGQTSDGRKWEKYKGKEVFPWDGASDIRPFFVDDLVNDDCDIMRTADKNCHMQTVPSNSLASEQATAQTAVLDFVSRAWMATELEREKELLAQWRQHYGSSVMGIDWWMDFDSEVVTVTVQDIMRLPQQMPKLSAMLAYVSDNSS
jgi:hypothetical protein